MRDPAKPEWLKVKATSSDEFQRIRYLGKERLLHTVCDASQCPNISECWSKGNTTFMLLGDTCTRNCGFCAVKTGGPKGMIDPQEPGRIAKAVNEIGLKHVVITSVSRDDLPDGGAGQFSQVIKAVKMQSPGTSLEVLVPDFHGDSELIGKVVAAGPDVFAHNIETVEGLQREIRDSRFSYGTSLEVLRTAKELGPRMAIKSSIMLGMGETRSQVLDTMVDLRRVGVDILTLGQYLRPKGGRYPVHRYLHPDEFEDLRIMGLRLGFKFIASGPLVRSSYMAQEAYLAFQAKVI